MKQVTKLRQSFVAYETLHEHHSGRRAVLDWLRLEFGIDKPSQKLQDVPGLNADGLAAEVEESSRPVEAPISGRGEAIERQNTPAALFRCKLWPTKPARWRSVSPIS